MQSGIEFSREETLEVLHSIAAFLKNHQCLWRAHVVEFFQDRLWEDIDIQWWDDLQRASLQDLLWLPSGKFQDTWCASLKDFVKTAQSLALFRQPGMDLERIFPGLSKPKISSVLRQGMNFKKLHEVEVLSAVVNQLAQTVHATHIVDVGAGQGYLAQVLAFEYGLPVMALDACAHHANVTNERSERIKKHYMSCSRRSKQDCTHVTGPQTATFHVMSGNSQMELQNFLSNLGPERLSSQTMDDGYTKNGKVLQGESCFPEEKDVTKQLGSSEPEEKVNSFVLAGLHACGDLSVTMLQTYMMCEEVKAVVTVGCCYNLLSENDDDEHASGNAFGFPLSDGVKGLGLSLGRRARDLACQSADRWKDVGMESAMYNFQQHALRAGFQLVLHKYHPELAELNPTVGRLGKARRRKQVKRHSMVKNTNDLNLGVKISTGEAHHSSSAIDLMSSSGRNSRNSYEDIGVETNKVALNDRDGGGKRKEFIEFARAAFERLGLESVAEKDLEDIWKGIEPKSALIGPYWSLRAVLGPVLETYILLDRLLYLQEQLPPVTTDVGPLKGLSGPSLVALFDPEISPRNMAILVMRN